MGELNSHKSEIKPAEKCKKPKFQYGVYNTNTRTDDLNLTIQGLLDKYPTGMSDGNSALCLYLVI